MIEFVTLHFFTILTFLLIFATIGHLLMQRKKPSSTIAWTVTIIALPYIGIFFYILFHGRKLDKVIKNLKEIRLKNIYEVQKLLTLRLKNYFVQMGLQVPLVIIALFFAKMV